MAGRNGKRTQEADTGVDSSLGGALAALANPMRLRIVKMLRDREQCVCHLTEALGLTQGTVSYHMGFLKQAGLVRDRRDANDGRWVYYRLDANGVSALQASLSSLLDTTRTDRTPADCCAPSSACNDHQG